MLFRKLIIPVLFFLQFHSLFSQDTLYYDNMYEQVNDTSKAVFIEILKFELPNKGIAVTQWKNGTHISVLRYSDYENNVLEGRCKYFYREGGICLDISYVDGKRQGKALSYYRSGNLKRQVTWDNDTVVSGIIFKENGKPYKNIYRSDLENDLEIAQIPVFPGGESALMQFLSEKTEYPVTARDKKIEGLVKLTFVVDKMGNINHINVIESPDIALSNEAVRVVGLMPRWNPGNVGGVPVKVKFTLPIRFQLQG